MKVVHVVEAWKGGVASYVEALIKEQVRRGYQVYLLADSAQLATDARCLGVELIEYESSRNPLRFFSISRILSREIFQINPDVVHCHSTFPGVYVRLLKLSCKVIYTPHGWSFFKNDVSSISRYVYRRLESALSSRCFKVMCMSAEEVKAAHEIGIPADRISLVYTGINDCVSWMSEEQEDGDINSPLKVGYFGRFDFQKGFDLLERALERLNDNLEVHLFGGAVREEERSMHPRFLLHGWIEHRIINECMKSMDVVVIPSRWEGFALTPLEAMRAGRPVVVSNLSSLPEVVINGYNGLVFSDYSPGGLASVLNSLTREDCRRMGKNARAVYEQCFEFEGFANRVDRLYRS